MTRRLKILVLSASLLCVLGVALLLKPRSHSATPPSTVASAPAEPTTAGDSSDEPTLLYAHNLLLRQGSIFKVYVRWISGKMLRTRKSNPSFDDPDSFALEIDKGVLHVGLQDVVDYLNSPSANDLPLKNLSITADADTLKIHGTVHKIIPLPVMISGTLTPEHDGRVRFHVAKIDVLKIPLKGLLGKFHVELADLIGKTKVPGVQAVDNDIFFDTQTLLPPPHIRGVMTSVKIVPPNINVIYGNAPDDDAKLAQWHNFLRLRGGTVDFGKLTMKHTDLTLIDATQAPWFDLDLVNYQAQLVNGYSRMTADAGLEMYLPAAGTKKPTDQAINLEWLKNRNTSLPADVPK